MGENRTAHLPPLQPGAARHRWWSWIVGAAVPAVAVAVMLLRVAALPMQDFPEHAHMASVLIHGSVALDSGEPAYDVDLGPNSYVGLFWVWRFLGLLFSAELAGRILVMFYVLACVLATVAVTRRVVPQMPLLASLALGWWMPFSFFYYMGFLPFLMTIPVLLLLIAALFDAVTRAGGGGSLFKVGLLTVASFLIHPQGIALAFGLIITAGTWSWLTRHSSGPPGEVRASTPRLAEWVGVLVLGALLLLLAMGPVSDTVRGGLTPASRTNPVAPDSWGDTALLMARLPLGPLQGAARTVQWVALFSLLAAMGTSFRAKPGREITGPRRAFSWWMLLCAATLLGVSYLLAGNQLQGTIYHRLFVYPPLLLLLAWAARATWHALPVGLLFLASGLHLSAVQLAHWAFHQEVLPAREMLAQLPPEGQLLPLLFDRDSRAIHDEYVHAMHHVAGFHPARFGGIYPYSPDHAPLPVRPRFSRSGIPPPTAPWKFQWTKATRATSHILLRAPRPEVMRVPLMRRVFEQTVEKLNAERQFLRQEGRWGLWGPVQRSSGSSP